MFRRALLPLAAAFLFVGCVGSGPRGDRVAAPRAGLDDYRLIDGEARARAGCRYDYRVYEPDAASATVLLGHGFLRDQDTLVGLARALAGAGFRAVTLDFCNMRPWNGHHLRNAHELRALAARVAENPGGGDPYGGGPDAGGTSVGGTSGTGRTPVVFAGFSAGALAALLAAAGSPDAGDLDVLGVVTLDLVDQGDLALEALARLDVPLVGLQGAPSACNANGSGQRVFDARPGASLVTLDGASHCEFEAPTGRLCELVCGDDDAPAADERVRAEVLDRVVAAVRRLARGAPARGVSPPPPAPAPLRAPPRSPRVHAVMFAPPRPPRPLFRYTADVGIRSTVVAAPGRD